MVIMLPINAMLASKARKMQINQMQTKDSRIKLVNEVLNGIKVGRGIKQFRVFEC